MLGNSKTGLPKHPGVVGSIGRIFLSSGCKVWGSNASIFQNFKILNFEMLFSRVLACLDGFGND